VTIGVGSVVGANSVVVKSIHDHCVAAGAPARVLKTIVSSIDQGAGWCKTAIQS